MILLSKITLTEQSNYMYTESGERKKITILPSPNNQMLAVWCCQQKRIPTFSLDLGYGRKTVMHHKRHCSILGSLKCSPITAKNLLSNAQKINQTEPLNLSIKRH